jgi:hypothetical protein
VPDTVPASPVGAEGRLPQGPTPIANCTSFDGALAPAAFADFTRTKYVPLATPLAARLVAALPIENTVRLLEPGADPASMVYDVGEQPPFGACHARVTAALLTEAVNPLGAPGALVQPPPCTVTTISFDAALVPLAFRARTRT